MKTRRGRAREAKATIASAYRRAPCEPIPQPRQAAHEQVNALVSRFKRDEAEPQRPMVEQIREAVAACACLNPLEWAAERKRLKAICGDVFRVEDLNQMYKQARRELERSQQPEMPGSPFYAEIDGSMVFEKPTERGTVRQIVAEWVGHVVEWIIHVNDDGQAEHVMRLELRHTTHATTLDVPSELFGDHNALQRFNALRVGGVNAACAGMNKHLHVMFKN